MWIAGIYDAGDFDEVVWMLIGTDFVGSPVRLAGTAPLPLISVFTGVGVSPVVAGGRLTIRPRSPHASDRPTSSLAKNWAVNLISRSGNPQRQVHSRRATPSVTRHS